jgi:hypothetical protein
MTKFVSFLAIAAFVLSISSVEATAVSLMNDANFNVSKGLISGLQGYKAKVFHHLSLGLLRHHLAKQYIMLGDPTDGEIRQQPVKWMTAE